MTFDEAVRIAERLRRFPGLTVTIHAHAEKWFLHLHDGTFHQYFTSTVKAVKWLLAGELQNP